METYSCWNLKFFTISGIRVSFQIFVKISRNLIKLKIVINKTEKGLKCPSINWYKTILHPSQIS